MDFLSTTNVEIEGVEVKGATCEKCEVRYHYVVVRSGAGDNVGVIPTERGENTARSIADRRLEKALEKAVDLVACPSCGWFQGWMIRAKRMKILKITLLCSFLVPWPSLMSVVLYYKKNKPTAPSNELLETIFLTMGLSFGGVILIGVILTLIARPNSGKFFPMSKANIDNGYGES